MTNQPTPEDILEAIKLLGQMEPCPYCESAWVTMNRPANGSASAVKCNACNALGPHWAGATDQELVDSWNKAALLTSTAKLTARIAELEAALRPFARAAKWWKAFNDFHHITALHQHGDCLEVHHLRDARTTLGENTSGE